MSDIWWQYLVVAVLVAWSLLRLWRQLAPRRTPADAGCGSGCSRCGGCSPTPSSDAGAETPVAWR